MSAAASQHYMTSWRFSAAEQDRERLTENVESTAGVPHRSLHALLRKQAAHLIDWTLHAELEILLAQHASVTDARGRPAYVRNGYQPPRDLLTNLGPVRIRIPKVRSRVDRPVIFRSALARPYLRRARSAMHQAPAHFLRGLSTGDLHAAIRALMGPEAAALSVPVLRRLSERWDGEHRPWLSGTLARLQGSSLWLDSIDDGEDPPHGIGSVMLAVAIDASGREQILSVVQADSETEQSWVQLLHGLRSRGMPPPLKLLLGSNGQVPKAAATAMVYPETVPVD